MMEKLSPNRENRSIAPARAQLFQSQHILKERCRIVRFRRDDFNMPKLRDQTFEAMIFSVGTIRSQSKLPRKFDRRRQA